MIRQEERKNEGRREKWREEALKMGKEEGYRNKRKEIGEIIMNVEEKSRRRKLEEYREEKKR